MAPGLTPRLRLRLRLRLEAEAEASYVAGFPVPLPRLLVSLPSLALSKTGSSGALASHALQGID